MADLISRQAAIDAIIEDKICDDSLKIMTAIGDGDKAEALNMTCDRHAKMLMDLPSAQPEYYDYSDIEPLWKSFAEENDINLTSTAKQLKGAMWCGYRKGKQAAQPEWSNHTVACLLAELFGDTCACNYNDIDEWLPEKCEVIGDCPNPVGVACWEQYLKHRAERRTDE